MTRWVLLVVASLLAPGCAALSPSAPPAQPSLLARADDRLMAAQYKSALALYDEFLRTHPNDPETPRARAARAVVERLLLAQTENERLRRELGARQSDLAARQGEIDQLRADLERLRRIDLAPEAGVPSPGDPTQVDETLPDRLETTSESALDEQ